MRFPIFSTLLSTQDSELMDYEENVLQRYPHADSLYLVPIQHHGDSTPCCEGEWVVLERPGCVDSELGRGPTEESAWEDAARKIAPERCPEGEAA